MAHCPPLLAHPDNSAKQCQQHRTTCFQTGALCPPDPCLSSKYSNWGGGCKAGSYKPGCCCFDMSHPCRSIAGRGTKRRLSGLLSNMRDMRHMMPSAQRCRETWLTGCLIPYHFKRVKPVQAELCWTSFRQGQVFHGHGCKLASLKDRPHALHQCALAPLLSVQQRILREFGKSIICLPTNALSACIQRPQL